VRTLPAKFIVQHLAHPRPLVVQAWLWLAAKAKDLVDKRHCVNTILELDPENEPASLALLVLDRKRPTN